MAEALIRTLKRDHVRVNPTPDTRTVIEQLSTWPDHSNEVHPHKALGYRSPRENIDQTREPRQAFRGKDRSLIAASGRRPAGAIEACLTGSAERNLRNDQALPLLG